MLIVSRVAMFLFLLATPFLFYGFGAAFAKTAARVSAADARWLFFAGGAALFFPVWLVFSRVFPAIWGYLTTFEHELTHLLAGLVFLKLPVSFKVTAHRGGEVKSIGLGSTGQTWVTLAPYFFPTVSLALIGVSYLVEMRPSYFLAALGWTCAFHLVTNWAETSFRQPDLKKAGVLKTLLILPLMNLLTYGTIAAFVGDGRAGLASFWTEGLRGAWALAAQLRHVVIG